MANQVINVEFLDRRVRTGLKQMGSRASGLAKAFRQLRIMLRADLAAFAAREASPAGPWPKRAQSTMDRVLQRAGQHTYVNRERRRRGHSGPLQQGTSVTRRVTEPLGKLPLGRPGSRMTTTTHLAELIAKSPVRDVSIIQNEGGTAGRGSRIPARGYVFLSPGFLDRARDHLAEFVYEGWRRA